MQLLPWMSLAPWLPFLLYSEAQVRNLRIIEKWLQVEMALLGCLVLVTYQFGAFVARIVPGYS